MPIRKTGSLPEPIDRQVNEIIRAVNVIEEQIAKLSQGLRQQTDETEGLRNQSYLMDERLAGQAEILESHGVILAEQGGRLDELNTLLNGGIGQENLTTAVSTALNPPGTILAFAGPVPPEGYLECDGREVSRTEYAALFAAIGTTWGEGDGVNTFNIPDLRGEFLRGWDNGRGVDPGRLLGSEQGDAIRNIVGEFDAQGFVPGGDTNTGAFFLKTRGKVDGNYSNESTYERIRGFDASRVVPTAEEVRPRNKAVMYIIKY